MSTAEKIHNAASKNRELLAILSETDYAPPALQQQEKYINDINQELQQLSNKIQTLTNARAKEHKEHEKYRDSVMKRFAYRVGRKTEKFEAKASKEEKEYFDALHAEHQAKEHEKQLQTSLTEAQSQKSQLEPIAARHRQAQSDLDALYDSIFEGPTPGFPEEDAKENAAQSALNEYHEQRVAMESETQALNLLEQATRQMAGVVRSMDSARGHSQMDMFGGGMMWDMMERDALSQAESQAQSVQMSIMQAQRMSPYVNGVPMPGIAKGNFMSDVLFDNVFTDYSFHQKIKQSQVEVERSGGLLKAEVGECKRRCGDMNGKLGVLGQRLERARVELQDARVMAFERVLGEK